MAKKRQRMVFPRIPRTRRRQFRSTTDYAMRGMVDMGKMAMFGAVTTGTIGAIGSLIKK